ncbi:axoneme-associated protein mst101(2)-like [Gigantopelta aegis]|uniref:axoneme-associated protein mst101(2)-like n=1 Tax=Gigantopelta aegis TaxID=1735272 RepID=UPI001B88DF61|nr:axoneme-associated protein mst101(2)-like [Gigantopelta aegis]
MSAGDDKGPSVDVGVTRSAVKDKAAMFGATKPAVVNRPGKSVLNRFPQAMANDDNNEASKTTPGYRGVNKFQASPPGVAPKTSQSAEKKPPPVFNKTSPAIANKPVSNNSTSSFANKLTPISNSSTPPVANKPTPSVANKFTPPVANKSPPSTAIKTTTGLANKKVWTPPNKTVEDHNHNVKGVADTNKTFQSKTSGPQSNSNTFSGSKRVTSVSSFQDKTNTSTDSDNRRSSSDGTLKELDNDKNGNLPESNEILSNLRNQLRASKTRNRSADPGKVVLQSNRQRASDDVAPVGSPPQTGELPANSNKTTSPTEILRKTNTKKRISVVANIKSRLSDEKKFKLISKGTLISSHDAPNKPRRPADIDISKIVQEYEAAVKELLEEEEDLYDDVESFARGSCLANRVSFIPDMTEEEELGSDQTSGSGSISASGSGGGFKQILDDTPVVEGEMEDVYEEFIEDMLDSPSAAELKEKEKAANEKEEKERQKREKEEKKKKEAARKEQEKKEKAEKARQEKERLAKEKKEKEKKEKEEKEKEKKKKLKSESADETSTKGSTNGEAAPGEEEYDDCSAMVDGVMEEEYADVDDFVSSSSTSSLQTTDKAKEEKAKRDKEDKEEKKKKEAARKEEERKKKEKQKEEKEKLAKEKKEKEKKEKEERDLKKKFKITGTEEKMSSGVILEDVKGGRHDLAVSKGDLVDIMRMDSNPTGKFLVKSEDNRWGYVESSNIQIDTDCIKEMTSAAVHVMNSSETYVNVESPITESGSAKISDEESSIQEEVYEDCS